MEFRCADPIRGIPQGEVYFIGACPACPACSVAPEDGTGVAPADGTGVKFPIYFAGAEPI